MLSGYGVFCSATLYVTLFCSLLISTCTSTLLNPFYVPYSLGKPDKEYKLEKKLKEVSGLNITGNDEAALIDDEKGALYYYNLSTNRVLRSIKFSKKADYEDLVILGDTAFILKSDGSLSEIILNENENVHAVVHDTPLDDFNDTEGLCYDRNNGVILIACKGRAGFTDEKKYRYQKAIYSFNPVTKKLNEKPVILIDVRKVERMILGMQKNLIRRVMNLYNLSTKSIFQPSGIAIHPVTGEIYVISAVGNVLLILNQEGKIMHAIKLSTKLFKQPEGIAFDSSATLYIANEGKSGKGTILRFSYKEKE